MHNRLFVIVVILAQLMLRDGVVLENVASFLIRCSIGSTLLQYFISRQNGCCLGHLVKIVRDSANGIGNTLKIEIVIFQSQLGIRQLIGRCVLDSRMVYNRWLFLDIFDWHIFMDVSCFRLAHCLPCFRLVHRLSSQFSIEFHPGRVD